jgi:hypothetical protein
MWGHGQLELELKQVLLSLWWVLCRVAIKVRTRLPWNELIEKDNAATGVHVDTSRESVENEVTGWEPWPAVVVEATKKFLPS